MKKNYEELNYRVRKELLNNFGYYCYFNLYFQVLNNSIKEKFNYNAWVKGLFKTNGIDDTTLAESLTMYYQDFLSDSESLDVWEEDYSRVNSIVDMIYIPKFTSDWVALNYAEDFGQENEYLWRIGTALALSCHSSQCNEFMFDKLKDFSLENRPSENQVLQITKDWVSKFVELNVK